ncbi:unnamed protein product [Lactuca saligna]|uniref:Uncharacterized protein n=1 Tax=Lactuca saligna TaxID=75948 RepID=A0AA35ZGX3_LACSI|nr:unnamed protein product [Lactuca saligna]
MQLRGETKSPKNSSTPPSPKIKPHNIFHGVGDWGSTTPQTRNTDDFKAFHVPDIKEELGFLLFMLRTSQVRTHEVGILLANRIHFHYYWFISQSPTTAHRTWPSSVYANNVSEYNIVIGSLTYQRRYVSRHAFSISYLINNSTPFFTPLFLFLQTTKKQQQQHKKDGRRKRLIPSSSSSYHLMLSCFWFRHCRRSIVEGAMEHSYSYYSGCNGTDHASGAYIFCPNATFPIKSQGQKAFTRFSKVAA